MPFGSLHMPSIGISLLQSGLIEVGHACDVLYLNLKFPEFIGLENYTIISDAPPTILSGEWVFSDELYGPADPAPFFENMARVVSGRPTRLTQEILRFCKSKVKAYLDQCLVSINWQQYDVIGFTTVFEQNTASLALAKMVKENFPSIHVLFGGANCEGVMGKAILREFTFVDAVCRGEGDVVVPEYVTKLSMGDSAPNVSQLLIRSNLHLGDSAVEGHVTNLNALPHPNYDDYFSQLNVAGINDFIQPSLPFESSRGCWWGRVQHCTFCGLNGSNIAFRSKGPARMMEELLSLYGRYHHITKKFTAVDNILDYSYFKDFIPRLAELNLGIDLFYETKANLSREQLQLFCKAGFTGIQPGIESLITPVLKIMRKGVSLMQNIRLLKWCKEFGLHVAWNILYGFPGEEPSQYSKVVDVISAITHLQPPTYCGQFRLDRFSPYFDAQIEHGLMNVRPCKAYSYVYRLISNDSLKDVAYYFDYEYADGRMPNEYTVPMMNAVEAWRKAYATAELCYKKIGKNVVIYDSRMGAVEITAISDWEAIVLESCDAITTINAIVRVLVSRGYDIESVRIRDYLYSLTNRGWVLCEGDQYISLTIPIGVYAPSEQAQHCLNNYCSSVPLANIGDF